MKSNDKRVNEAFRKHLLELIEDNEGETTEDKLKEVLREWDGWNSEYERRNQPNHQFRFMNYLMGLPSTLTVYYAYDKSLEFMAEIGLPLPENKTYQEGHKLYLYLIFKNLNRLLKEFKLKEIGNDYV